jgi:selenide,water dikinase
VEFQVDAMTDVTGFGLIGHAAEIAKASRISIHIDHTKLPLLPGTLEYSRAGFCAGGLTSNQEFFQKDTFIPRRLPSEIQNVLFDPQTSGGLLIFCQSQDADALITKLQAEKIHAVEIGFTSAPTDHLLTVT